MKLPIALFEPPSSLLKAETANKGSFHTTPASAPLQHQLVKPFLEEYYSRSTYHATNLIFIHYNFKSTRIIIIIVTRPQPYGMPFAGGSAIAPLLDNLITSNQGITLVPKEYWPKGAEAPAADDAGKGGTSEFYWGLMGPRTVPESETLVPKSYRPKGEEA